MAKLDNTLTADNSLSHTIVQRYQPLGLGNSKKSQLFTKGNWEKSKKFRKSKKLPGLVKALVPESLEDGAESLYNIKDSAVSAAAYDDYEMAKESLEVQKYLEYEELQMVGEFCVLSYKVVHELAEFIGALGALASVIALAGTTAAVLLGAATLGTMAVPIATIVAGSTQIAGACGIATLGLAMANMELAKEAGYYQTAKVVQGGGADADAIDAFKESNSSIIDAIMGLLKLKANAKKLDVNVDSTLSKFSQVKRAITMVTKDGAAGLFQQQGKYQWMPLTKWSKIFDAVKSAWKIVKDFLKVMSYIDKIADFIKKAGKWVGDKAKQAWNFSKRIANKAGGWVSGKAHQAMDLAEDAWDWGNDRVADASEWIGDKAKSAWSFGKSMASKAWNWTKGKAAQAKEKWQWGKGKAEDAHDWFGEKKDQAVEGVKNAWSFGKSIASKAWNWTKERASDAKEVGGSIWGGIKGAPGAIARGGQTALAFAKEKTKGFFRSKVPYSGDLTGPFYPAGPALKKALPGIVQQTGLEPDFEVPKGEDPEKYHQKLQEDLRVHHEKNETRSSQHGAIAGGAAIYINGVDHNMAEHYEAAQRLADALGHPVVGIYNPSAKTVGNSKLRDFAQCVGDKAMGLSGNQAIDTVKYLVRDFGNPKSSAGGLKFIAHSQGSIILSEGLRQAKEEGGDITSVDATTVGNAAWAMPDGPTYRHFVHRKDIISNSVGSKSFYERFAAMFGGSGTSRTAKNMTVLDHKSSSPTVQHNFFNNSEDGDYVRHTAPLIKQAWANKKAGGSGVLPAMSGVQDSEQLRKDIASGKVKYQPKPKVQRKGFGISPDVDPSRLRSDLLLAGGAGQAPDSTLRNRLEPHLGFDAGVARMHRGPTAAAAARALSAEAFTIGSDVFFGDGAFDRHSGKGLGLIAHELTHVGQQAGMANPQTMKFGESSHDAMERQAEATGSLVMSMLASGPQLEVLSCETEVSENPGIASDPSIQARLESLQFQAIEGASISARALGLLDAGEIDFLECDLEIDPAQMSDGEIVGLWSESIVRSMKSQLTAGSSRTQNVTLLQKRALGPASGPLEEDYGYPRELESGNEIIQRKATGPPTPVKLTDAKVKQMDTTDKLVAAAEMSLSKMPGEFATQVRAMLTKQALLQMAATFAIVAFAQAIPGLNVAVDTVLAGAAIYALGDSAYEVGQSLVEYATKASDAESVAELDAAAAAFAHAITLAGVEVLEAILPGPSSKNAPTPKAKSKPSSQSKAKPKPKPKPEPKVNVGTEATTPKSKTTTTKSETPVTKKKVHPNKKKVEEPLPELHAKAKAEWKNRKHMVDAKHAHEKKLNQLYEERQLVTSPTRKTEINKEIKVAKENLESLKKGIEHRDKEASKLLKEAQSKLKEGEIAVTSREEGAPAGIRKQSSEGLGLLDQIKKGEVTEFYRLEGDYSIPAPMGQYYTTVDPRTSKSFQNDFAVPNQTYNSATRLVKVKIKKNEDGSLPAIITQKVKEFDNRPGGGIEVVTQPDAMEVIEVIDWKPK